MEAIIAMVKEKIMQREKIYGGTWVKVPVEDLIAVARLKTFRATKALTIDKYKAEDDLIDAIAYLIFAMIKLQGGDLSDC
ncbi:MAG: hypothetical protein QXV61_00050 [Archaeoglobaceae archaeon]